MQIRKLELPKMQSPQPAVSSAMRAMSSSSNFSSYLAFRSSICCGVLPATILMMAFSVLPPSMACLISSQSASRSTRTLGWVHFRTAAKQFLKEPLVSDLMCLIKSLPYFSW